MPAAGIVAGGTVGSREGGRNFLELPRRAIARFTRKRGVSIARHRFRAIARVTRDSLPIIAIARGWRPRDRHALSRRFTAYRAGASGRACSVASPHPGRRPVPGGRHVPIFRKKASFATADTRAERRRRGETENAYPPPSVLDDPDTRPPAARQELLRAAPWSPRGARGRLPRCCGSSGLQAAGKGVLAGPDDGREFLCAFRPVPL